MHKVAQPITSRQLNTKMSHLINQTAFEGLRFRIYRHQRAVAAIVTLDDLRTLESLDAIETEQRTTQDDTALTGV